MSLVPLLTPDSEAELLTTVALLEAHGIPVHVRGGGFGSLYPGPLVPGFNAKTILVPEEALQEASALLGSCADGGEKADS
jgi:FAD/FMN-containing dehydrogenase